MNEEYQPLSQMARRFLTDLLNWHIIYGDRPVFPNEHPVVKLTGRQLLAVIKLRRRK